MTIINLLESPEQKIRAWIAYEMFFLNMNVYLDKDSTSYTVMLSHIYRLKEIAEKENIIIRISDLEIPLRC